MPFIAPIWLLGLIPWAALTAWLLWGQRPKQLVPFLPLWQGPVHAPRNRQGMRVPPLGLSCMLAAMLLALLAAARPVLPIWGGARFQGAVTIIVDCGQTMSIVPASGSGGAGEPRFAALAGAVAAPLRERLGDGPVEMIDLPLGRVRLSDRAGWADLAAKLPRTAADTRSQLAAIVQRRLRCGDAAIIVLSDHALTPSPRTADAVDRIVQIAPPPVDHAGIIFVSARVQPHPQVMVRVRNQSGVAKGNLTVVSGGQSADVTVNLPPRGQERNFFVDLPTLGDTIQVTLQAGADLAADQQAWLVRQSRRPTIEARAPLPASLQRMIDVYQRHQAAGDSDSSTSTANHGPDASLSTNVIANVIAIVPWPGKLEPTEAGVVLGRPGEAPASTLPADAGTRSESAPGSIRAASPLVVSHPATAALDWPRIAEDAVLSTEPPIGNGWLPVVSLDGKPMVEVRQAPARQVWVGFDSPTWWRRPDYVVFWANVFNWLGDAEGRDEYVSQTVGPLGSEWKARELAAGLDSAAAAAPPPAWWPGIYELRDGTAKRAVNAPDVPVDTASPTDWRAKLAEIARSSQAGQRGFDVTPLMLLGAVTSVAVAAMAWQKRRRSVEYA